MKVKIQESKSTGGYYQPDKSPCTHVSLPAALVCLPVVAEVVGAVCDVARAAPLRPREDEESAQGRRVLRPTRRNL